MNNNNEAVTQSSMARHYVPETKAQTEARLAVDDWRPGEPLRFRRKAKPQTRKDWKPMTYEMKRALINARCEVTNQQIALHDALCRDLSHEEAVSD